MISLESILLARESVFENTRPNLNWPPLLFWFSDLYTGFYPDPSGLIAKRMKNNVSFDLEPGLEMATLN